MDRITLTFVLLAIYQLKHYLADFPLQTPWMLGKFNEKGWVKPLAAHAGVHACFTGFICSIYFALLDTSPKHLLLVFGLALFDFATHFTMDRIKASPKMLGKYKSLCSHNFQYKDSMAPEEWARKVRSNKKFWRSLGIDQMVHHLTHYYIVWRLIHAC
jgi:hypothetical protein